MQSVCVRFRLPASLRGDRVDRDHVERARAHEHVGDLQCLLAVVGLGHEQLVDVDADRFRVERVHGVLGVDERTHPSELLRLREHVVDHRGLAGGLGAEHLDDPPPGHATDPQGQIERQRAGGYRLAAHLGALVAHAHDRALAELALDLRERALKGGVARLGCLLLIGHRHGLTPRFEMGSSI